MKRWNQLLVLAIVVVLLLPATVVGTLVPCRGVYPVNLEVDDSPDPSCVGVKVTISGSYNVVRHPDWFPPWMGTYDTGVDIKIYDSGLNVVNEVTLTLGVGLGDPGEAGEAYTFTYGWTARRDGVYTYEVIAWTNDTYYGRSETDIVCGMITVEYCCVEPVVFQSDRASDWEVYKMWADGRYQENLTKNLADDTSPAWSLDGEEIAFASNRDGNWEVYKMGANGRYQENLTANLADDTSPAWSPDGEEIAFASNRDGNWEVYKMWADGRYQENLTANLADDTSPAWSPDGEEIVFASNRDGNWEVYKMGADGRYQENLTKNLADDTSPAWSLDGEEIVFASNRDGNWEVYKMGADGRYQENLTKNPSADTCPAGWPYCDGIFFQSDRDGNWEVYKMWDNGLNQENLTENPAADKIDNCAAPAPRTPVIIVPGYFSTMCNWKHDREADNCQWSGIPICFLGFCLKNARQVYAPLLQALIGAGYREGIDLFVTLYDWTRPNDQSAEQYLKATIQQAIGNDPNKRVHIITHSNGALVARNYIQASGPSRVDKLIMIAPPSQGIVDAYLGWAGGDVSFVDDLKLKLLLHYVALKKCRLIYLGDPHLNYDCIHQKLLSLRELLPDRGPYLYNLATWRLIDLEDMDPGNQNPQLKDLNDRLVESLLGDVSKAIVLASQKDKAMEQIYVVPHLPWDGELWKDGGKVVAPKNKPGDGTLLGARMRLPLGATYLNVVEDFSFSSKHTDILGERKLIDAVLGELGVSSSEIIASELESESFADAVVAMIDGQVGWKIKDPSSREMGVRADGSVFNNIPEASIDSMDGTYLAIVPNPLVGTYELQISGNRSSVTEHYVAQIFDARTEQTLLSAEDSISPGQVRTYTSTYAEPATLIGSVTLQGRPAPPNDTWIIDLDVAFYDPATGSLLWSDSVTTDASGNFQQNDIGQGTYNVLVRGLHTLSRRLQVTVQSGTNMINFGTLLEGDANGDNCVNAPDFSILRTAFGKCQGQEGYDARADFDQDGCVNAPDFSLLRTNFGLCGDITV